MLVVVILYVVPYIPTLWKSGDFYDSKYRSDFNEQHERILGKHQYEFFETQAVCDHGNPSLYGQIILVYICVLAVFFILFTVAFALASLLSILGKSY